MGAAAAAAVAVALFAVATLERSLSPRAQMLLGVVAYDPYPAYSYPAAREACENQQYPQYPQYPEYPPYPQYPQKMAERQELALPGVIYFPTSAGIEMCINAYLEQVPSCAASSLFLRVVPLSPPAPLPSAQLTPRAAADPGGLGAERR